MQCWSEECHLSTLPGRYHNKTTMKRQTRLPSLMLIATKDADVMGVAEDCFKPIAAASKTCKPPRQMVSDMKWEGDTWISPEDLANNVRKRPRRRGTTAAAAAVAAAASSSSTKRVRLEVEEMAVKRPPKPADPVDEVDATNVRRRDKDRIPSQKTYAWIDDAWTLIDRPIVSKCGQFFAYVPIPPKQEDLLRLMLSDTVTRIDEDFLRDGLIPRLNRTHPVSLRLLDWLVVDYAREKNIAYMRYIPTLKRNMIVVMHSLYSSWLHRWRRRHYDPFRRRHRIYFKIDDETYSTTVAQLHFFYMARLFGFLDYAADNLEDILVHMKTTLAETNEAKNGARERGEEYHRKSLVPKAHPRAFMCQGAFSLSFSLDDVTHADSNNLSDGEDDDDSGDDEDDGYDSSKEDADVKDAMNTVLGF